MTARIVVIGGGIAGLSAASSLASEKKAKDLALQVTVLESQNRLGGVIKSQEENDFVVEYGPESFITEKPWALKLCQSLGLENDVLGTNTEKRKSLVAWSGRLQPLPEGFVMIAPTKFWPFVTSPLFSYGGKLRIACDLFLPKRIGDSEDESVADFIKRRLGKEAFERVGQALIGGIYTGDAGALSARSSIPRFTNLEKKYGSIIGGLLREEKGSTVSGARYSLFVTLTSGMQTMVDALARSIRSENILLNREVLTIAVRDGSSWTVTLADGTELAADAIVVAVPAYQAARLLQNVDAKLSQSLSSIEGASSVVINCLFKAEDIPGQLNGFGFVVPSAEKRSILAASFTSQKFSGRAADGTVMIRVFIGGTLMPKLTEHEDGELERLALEDLGYYLGVKNKPVKTWIGRWPRSMPQYKIGHDQCVAQIEHRVREFKGLALAGNCYHGVGIPDCILSGERAAESVLESLGRQGLLK